jgi:histone acetyltransferase 1
VRVDVLSDAVQSVHAACELPGSEIERIESNNETFTIRKGSVSDASVQSYLQRAQIFVLFCIEAANYIDTSDSQWDVYFLFGKSAASTQSHFIGYSTVYNFFSYPDAIRQRISQFVILPPYQRRGHGLQLLGSIYNNVRSNEQIRDVTVEDPDPNFAIMRDTLDVATCIDAGVFDVERGLSIDDEKKIAARLKLYRGQVRRCFEICKMKQIQARGEPPEMWKQFEVEVKSRLFRRNQEILDGFQTKEERKEFLNQQYQSLLEAYRAVRIKN